MILGNHKMTHPTLDTKGESATLGNVVPMNKPWLKLTVILALVCIHGCIHVCVCMHVVEYASVYVCMCVSGFTVGTNV